MGYLLKDLIHSYQNHLGLSPRRPGKAEVVPLLRPVHAVVAVGQLQDVGVEGGPRVRVADVERAEGPVIHHIHTVYRVTHLVSHR